MTTVTRRQVELCQGTDEQERPFGYVHGDEDEGGFFFTWLPTLDATLASVEEDDEAGDGGLDRAEVVKFLRGCLPATRRGRRLWADGDE